MVGYVALGIPCGILELKAGMSVLQIALLSIVLYAGAGQYMIASMWLAGISLISLALSVALVNARQLLYAFALLPHFMGSPRWRQFFAASNITDESFGVNIARFEATNAAEQPGRPWNTTLTFRVNMCSHSSWVLSNIVGALIGSAVPVDTALAAFAMTALFICLLLMQKGTVANIIAGAAAVAAVIIFKLCGLSQVAVLLGALVGVGAGIAAHHLLRNGGEG
jgi:4-azaleucine resistance transporter AzlC